MFVRITFDDNQKVSRNIWNELSEFLGEEVTCGELVKTKNEDLTEFSTYWHSYDEEEVKLSQESERKKELVTKTDMVRLNTSKEYLGELESFMKKFPSIKIKIRGMIQVSESNSINMINQMVEVQKKLEKALSQFDEKIEFNQKCDVHISNLGLLSINQLGFATDKCTEELQVLVNEGWRILAICPQPDQRRPDYVLGRSMPNLEEGYRYQEVLCTKF